MNWKSIFAPRSLFLKIFMWFWLAAAVMAGVWNLMFWLSLAEIPVPGSRGAFGEALKLYAESAVQVYDREGSQAFEQYVRRSKQDSGTEIYLFDGTGAALSSPVTEDAAKIAREVRDTHKNASHIFLGRLTWGRAVISPSGKNYIFVSRLRQAVLPRPSAFSPGRVIASVLVVGLVCYLLALYLTSPVKKLQTTVKNFAEGNLEARVSPELGSRRDELADLGREFDRMAERISSLISSQKRLLADISHELRSPLARLSIALELARKNSNGKASGPLDRIEQESERVNQLVGQLLTLTRLESGAEHVPPETVVLEDLVQQIIDDANFEAKPLNREVKAVQLDHCRVQGSAELLRSAIENVIRNAIRYTAEGSAVEVSLVWRLNTAVLQVRDYGPGVPESELQHIFEPFYRVSEARERTSGGTGLGLSIADRTIKLHGGAIRAENAKNGLIVTMELPLAPLTASTTTPQTVKVGI